MNDDPCDDWNGQVPNERLTGWGLDAILVV
jgi:hypothetical protein